MSADTTAQDAVWNAYYDKHNSEPSNVTQLLNFSRNTENNSMRLTFLSAKKTYNRNKGKDKISTQSESRNDENGMPELYRMSEISKKITITKANESEEEAMPMIPKQKKRKSLSKSAASSQSGNGQYSSLSAMVNDVIDVIDVTDITGSDIDNLLNEIDEDEAKLTSNRFERAKQRDGINGDISWRQITREIGRGNTTFLKNIITSNDIDINAQNPKDGKTLLIYSVITGNIDLVTVICNFGADIDIKDDDDFDALTYAVKYGQYKITELLYYRQLSGSLGNDMKVIAQQIHAKNKEAKLMMEFKYEKDWEDMDVHSGITQYMIQAMEKRAAFGQDMLYYAWYFVTHDNKIDNPLQTPLFKAMMKTYEKILANTSDKKGWKWLKHNYVNSLIWYLPHPLYNKKKTETKTDDDNDDSGDDKEATLKKTLFWELLTRVRKQSKKESDKLLKDEICKIKNETPQQWNDLISYNVNTEYSKDARQDTVGAIVPKYDKEDLSENIYPPSTHFSAQIHYDTNLYLNELLFQANILDTMFQRDMKYVTNEIKNECGLQVTYRAGPVKTLYRAKTKVENDYINEAYPTSAKILDINRCALQFDEIPDLMKFMQAFSKKIQDKKARSVIQIIRCKNGWSVYNPEYPQYTDIKLNVLIQDPHDISKKIIAEIQFLLSLMSAFKKKAHKLYSVERKFELVYNFGKLRAELDKFGDNAGTAGVIINLAKNDEIKYFKIMWGTMNYKFDALIDYKKKDVWQNPLLHIILKDGKINQYIKDEYLRFYKRQLIRWVRWYVTTHEDKYKELFKSISSAEDDNRDKDDILARILEQIFELIGDDKDEYLRFLQKGARTTFLEALLESKTKYNKCFTMILNNRIMSDKEKFKLLGFDKNAGWSDCVFRDAARNDKQENTIIGYRYISNDKHEFLRILHHDRMGLENVLEQKDRLTTKLLDMVFDNKMFSKTDLLNLFSKQRDIDNETGKGKTLLYIALEGYHGIIARILRYFDPKGSKTKMIKKWIYSDGYVLMSNYGYLRNENVIMEILKYFRNDTRFIKKLMLKMDDDHEYCAMSKIWSNARFGRKKPKTLQKYVLYESGIRIKDLLDIHKLELFDGDDPSMVAMELIKYYKDDRRELLKILNIRDTNGKTIWMAVCKNGELLDLLLNGVLHITDIYRLCKVKDNASKTSFWYIFQESRFDEDEDPPYIEMMINKFKEKKWLLVKLLLQKTENDKPCIMFCDGEESMLTIFNVVKSNRIIEKLLVNKIGWESVKRDIDDWREYLAFDKLDFNEKKYHIKRKDDDNKDKMIDIEFSDWNENPLLTACKLRKYNTIKRYLEQFIKDNKKKLMKLLMNFHGYRSAANLVGYATSFETTNDDEMDYSILKLLVLDNEKLSDKEKFKVIIAKKERRGDTTWFMTSTQFCRLKVLEYFGNDKGYLPQILCQRNQSEEAAKKEQRRLRMKVERMNIFDSDDDDDDALNFDDDDEKKEDPEEDDKLAFNFITLQSPIRCDIEQTKDVIGYIMNSPILGYKIKVKLLMHEYNIEETGFDDDLWFKETSLRKACQFGYGSFMLNLIKNDRKTLLNVLHPENISDFAWKQTVLMVICKSKYKDPNVLQIIFVDSALTRNDKIKILQAKDDKDYTALYHAMMNKKNADYFYTLLDYLKNDFSNILIDLLTQKVVDGNMSFAKLIAEDEDDDNVWSRRQKDDGPDPEIYNKMKAVFCSINNDKDLRKLMNTKNRKFQRLVDIQEANTCDKWNDDPMGKKYEIHELLVEVMDYLKLSSHLTIEHEINNMIFDGYSIYSTNPFLSACKLGKLSAIIRLLEYVKNINNELLKQTLLDNYDVMTGDNFLMILYENGYCEMIVNVLEFLNKHDYDLGIEELLSVQNRYNEETLLIKICKKESEDDIVGKILSYVAEKQSIIKLLNQTDIKNNSCLDYAKTNLLITHYTDIQDIEYIE